MPREPCWPGDCPGGFDDATSSHDIIGQFLVASRLFEPGGLRPPLAWVHTIERSATARPVVRLSPGRGLIVAWRAPIRQPAGGRRLRSAYSGSHAGSQT